MHKKTVIHFFSSNYCALLNSCSKLTDFEREELDKPLEISELDNALKNANMRSAPGLDGFSYRFIHKFWHFFRGPLYNCAAVGLENNSLPDFFKTAVIKLIPKKGDLSMIKNWRPISLLSNFYKLISRLINARLQSVCDRLLSRAQKGFTKSRQIHEVIINCMETMDVCKKYNIKGVLASIDQTKAFDSVSHSYMEKVYTFFGFGARIKAWLGSIGTGRFAQIALGNDSLSIAFQLCKGHAQGDCPSPLLYNLAAQIQIFKLELNPNIDRIPRLENVPDAIVARPPFFKGEGFCQTDTNESFADDSSNLFLFNLNSLVTLKNVLSDFRILSGLSSNLEKSFIMRIGNVEGEVSPDISNLGFNFTNKIKLLGFTLQNYGDLTVSNYEQVQLRIDKQIRFWERFFLSLPGRITIYKTLLIPQINYIATVFTPNNATISLLQTMMEKFVTAGLSIKKERIYREVREGGLGLFSLDSFIAALQCSWIKRCCQSINDNWRYRITALSGGKPEQITYDRYTQGKVGRVISNIINSFCTFKSKFTNKFNNYMSVPIYCNTAFGYGRGLRNTLDDSFFDTFEHGDLRTTVLGLTWSDITVNGRILTRETLAIRFGLALTMEKYGLLCNVFRIATRKYYRPDSNSTSIRAFMMSFKKGTKNFRKVIDTPDRVQYIVMSTQAKTFLKTTETTEPSAQRLKSLFSNWNLHYLCSGIRVFIFKYYSNILGLNSRIAHFNREVYAGCTFCVMRKNLPAPKETLSHIFFNCPTTSDILVKFYEKYLRGITLEQNTFFLSNASEYECENKPLSVVLDLVRYVIWQHKLNKKLPNFNVFETELQYTLGVVAGASKSFERSLIDCKFFQRERQEIDGEHERP